MLKLPPKGSIRLDPETVDACLRLGLVQAGILTEEAVNSSEIHCYRNGKAGEKIGATISFQIIKK